MADERRRHHRPDGGRPGDAGAREDGRPAGDATGEPTEAAVVRTAADAAEGVVFAAYRKSEVRDLDVTVRFEDRVLEIDVYLNAPGDAEDVADEAARAARAAVDDLLE